MKSFKIKTLGCKVNQYETQAMREALLSAGFKELENSQKADIYIINTCTVTVKADKESRAAIRSSIRENPIADIVAAGCYAEADPQAIKAIDDRIKIISNGQKCNILGILSISGRQDYGISYFKGHVKAFIKIQDGCDNFCSYCKVPYVRGRSKSKGTREILEEAERLIRNGYKELVLTGICIGDFGKGLGDNVTLAWLVEKISDIKGDFRIRISSIELPDVTDGLINEMAYSKKLCHHLHIPLQSGDDEILRRMNRKYTASEFIKRIGYIRSKIPDIAITTDVIAGFPDESEINFKNSLEALKRIKPSRTHIFTYSPREETAAFNMTDNISSRVKDARFKQIKELTDEFAMLFKLEALKRQQRILIEGNRDRETGLLTGYTDTYIKSLVDGPDEFIGKLILKAVS